MKQFHDAFVTQGGLPMGVIWDDKAWDKEALREHFAPWRKIEAEGVNFHAGKMDPKGYSSAIPIVYYALA